jgi:hypothetical protein
MPITEPTQTPLDKDRLSMVPRHQAADAAHLALFGIQDERPEVQLLGISVLFAAFCHRCQLDPELMHHVGRKVLRDDQFHRQANDSLQSLKDFAGLRVMGQEVTIA